MLPRRAAWARLAMKRAEVSRRQFLHWAGAAAIALSPFGNARGQAMPGPAWRQGPAAGLIGCGVRGRALAGILGPRLEGLCDVDQRELQRARERLRGGSAQAFQDYRAMLDHGGIDAVAIATPNHWHAYMAADACDAGKDVYLEAPALHRTGELRHLRDAARRRAAVIQIGAPPLFSAAGQTMIARLRTGALGALSGARAWAPANAVNGTLPTFAPPPAALDWNQWIGPAAWRPYDAGYLGQQWRWVYDFGGGRLPGEGAAWFQVLAAAGAVPEGRVTVETAGAPAPAGALWDAPERLEARYRFEDGAFGIEWRQPGPREGAPSGLTVIGENGRLTLAHDARDGFTLLEGPADPEDGAERPVQALEEAIDPLAEWLACVETRRTPSGSLDEGCAAAALAQAGALAHRLGRPIVWNPAAGQIEDDPQAERLMRGGGRGTWQF